MRPFNLEEAKKKVKVCCRNGADARILCFDAKYFTGQNIIAIVEENTFVGGHLASYCSNGQIDLLEESEYDLMMAE